ncbi:hypothetical protein [Streptosporangium canum]|uniref:hypothetical protein n=1 Tax=Streptosporangium canum TaxID=324952 RepID=UPI0033A1E37A
MTTTAVELAAQIARLSAQLLAEVTVDDADVDMALALAHLAPAVRFQRGVMDVLAGRAGNTDGASWKSVAADVRSAAYFAGVVAARLTSAQASAEIGQDSLAREVAAARRAPAVSSEPELIARIQAEQGFVDRVWEEQKAAGQHPATSGSYSYREWRAGVLQACVCTNGVLSEVCRADCPVHAEALVILAG